MRTLFLLLWAAPFGYGLTTAKFLNGNSISGDIQGITETELSWNSDDLAGPQNFFLKSLSELEREGLVDTKLPAGDHLASVTLTNGDVCDGTLVNVTDQEIQLNTSYAGLLTFRRDMVDALMIKERPEIYYLGPESLDGWVVPDGFVEWKYQDGKIFPAAKNGGSIWREIGKHSRIHLSFDVDWAEGSRLRVYFHSTSNNPTEPRSNFELNIQDQYLSLQKRVQTGFGVQGFNIGNLRRPDGQEGGDPLHVEIYQDLKSGLVKLSLNNERPLIWQDNDPTPDSAGPYLMFTSESNMIPHISRIRVASWDGVLNPGESADRNQGLGFRGPHAAGEEKKEDAEGNSGQQIYLTNGDRVRAGDVEIHDGTARIKTKLREITLPVSRLRSFGLRSAEEAKNPELRWEPILRARDIRAWFPNGNRLTFELVSYTDGKMTGRSQTFGEAEFDSSVFSRVEFNLYRRP